MRDHMQADMAEATRLTREGRLNEASAVIQRTLGGAPAPTSPEEPSGEPIFRVVNEALQAASSSRRAAGRGPAVVTRAVPQLPSRLGGALRSLGTMPGMAAGSGAPAIVPAGGQFVERSYANRAGTRAYKLYIPSGYVGQAVSLVIMLHGCTQSPTISPPALA